MPKNYLLVFRVRFTFLFTCYFWEQHKNAHTKGKDSLAKKLRGKFTLNDIICLFQIFCFFCSVTDSESSRFLPQKPHTFALLGLARLTTLASLFLTHTDEISRRFYLFKAV